MKQLFLLILSLVFIGIPMQAEDPAKINISYSGGGDANPWRDIHAHVIVMNNDDIMFLWESGINEANCDIVYRILNPKTNTWYPSIKSKPLIAAKQIHSATFPHAVEDSNGVIHISYQDGNSQPTRDAFYTYFKDGKWAPIQRIVRTITNSAWPRIAIDKATDNIYSTWHHAHELGSHDSDIVFTRKVAGATSFEKLVNISKTAHNISIHQAMAYFGDRVYTIWQDGLENDWSIMANSGLGDHKSSGVGAPINIPGGENGYWPELVVDTQGTLYGTWQTNVNTLQYAYKEIDGPWTFGGLLNDGGRKDFSGLNIAPNDVAYAIHQVGYADGFNPVWIRFTKEHKTKRALIDHNSRYPKRFHIDVDDEGSMHCVWSDFPYGDSRKTDHFASDVWYRKISQVGGPKVSVSTDVDTVITNESVTFTGVTKSSENPITRHRWYINKNILESNTETFTKTFTQPGIYTIHYYVADSTNLMGHHAFEIEVLDVPYKPENGSFSIDLIKAYLYRGYVNQINWDDDSRNGSKFTDLNHYKIYKRQVGSSDWGTSVATVNYTATGAKYTDISTVFTSQSEASKVEYGITTIAIINGEEKESKLTTITFGGGSSSYAGSSVKGVVLKK